jgi:hypothetical protein
MSTDLCRSDAAYLLGALSPTERREFEAHLAGCADCRHAVRELAGIPGLLATASVADLEEQLPVPATLLPGLLSSVRRSRWRVRAALGVAGLAAAAAAAVLGVNLLNHEPSGYTEAMHQVVDSPVNATVSLVDKAWGTQIDLRCTYREGITLPYPAPTYLLVVTNKAGVDQQLGTWAVVPDKVATITGSTNWAAEDIASVKVETSSGKTLLSLAP